MKSHKHVIYYCKFNDLAQVKCANDYLPRKALTSSSRHLFLVFRFTCNRLTARQYDVCRGPRSPG